MPEEQKNNLTVNMIVIIDFHVKTSPSK